MENTKNIVYSYKELIVWQRSMELVVVVYELTKQYPKSEMYGLTSQTRRSAISIPSNIAGGRRRVSKVDSLLDEVMRMLNKMLSSLRS